MYLPINNFCQFAFFQFLLSVVIKGCENIIKPKSCFSQYLDHVGSEKFSKFLKYSKKHKLVKIYIKPKQDKRAEILK